MREILFRGIAEASDGFRIKRQWLYGSLLAYAGTSQIWTEDGHNFIVLPETVGQYTGLLDRNGKRIFEGDVLQCGNIKCVVAFGEYRHVDQGADYPNGDVGFHIAFASRENRLSKRNDIIFWVRHRDAEVIGNVHDNPELLEGGGKETPRPPDVASRMSDVGCRMSAVERRI